MLRDYIRLLRIKQWIKNAFVFGPLVFSLSFHLPGPILKSVLMCLAFCLTASSVYIINDICDRNRDRLHPQKRSRPIAGGRIPVTPALLLATALIAGAAIISLRLGRAPFIVLTIYLGMNILYSLLLKERALIDVMVIALGFILRVLAGGAAIGVEVSKWMLMATFFLALFLGFGKRRRELIVTGRSTEHREAFREYSREVVNYLIIISAGLTIITYSLYVLAADSTIIHTCRHFYATIPFVVYGVFRYMILIFTHDDGDDPTDALLKDKPLIIDIVLWIAFSMILLGIPLLYEAGA